MITEVTRDGSTSPDFDIGCNTEYDFDLQEMTPIAGGQSVKIYPTDQIRLTCLYDSRGRSDVTIVRPCFPSPRLVYFGQPHLSPDLPPSPCSPPSLTPFPPSIPSHPIPSHPIPSHHIPSQGGDPTTLEMCFNFLLYYPKQPDAGAGLGLDQYTGRNAICFDGPRGYDAMGTPAASHQCRNYGEDELNLQCNGATRAAAAASSSWKPCFAGAAAATLAAVLFSA